MDGIGVVICAVCHIWNARKSSCHIWNVTFESHQVKMPDMDKLTHSKRNLWRSLEALMTARWGGVNINRLSRESGVGLGTVARLKSDDTSIALDKLDLFAKLFGVEPWELLTPNFSENSQNQRSLSPMAVDVALSLDQITDPAAHARAHALVVQVLQLANVPAPQESQPAAQATPAPHPSR